MIFVVASMTNRTMPVNVFRMKPAHMYGYIFRTHTEKPLCSIAARNCIIRKRPLFAERRHYTGIEDLAEWQNEKLRHLMSTHSPPRKVRGILRENSVRRGAIGCMLAAIKEFQTVPQGK